MPSKNTKKKLKALGKHGKECRQAGKTVYDADGHWVGPTAQHQNEMRQLKNPLFDRYYNELQALGEVTAITKGTRSVIADVSSADAVSADAGTLTASAAAWAHEMQLFRQTLPTTFWINDTDPLAANVRSFMETLPADVAQSIPWYPIEGMGWRVLADKTELRKRPELQQLRQFLIQQTALGSISRQEEVSMIPPFLLDIQPNDVCLDMCASPGSKTAQMLVALGRHKMVPYASPDSPFPFDYQSGGLVMANELDSKRANMLVYQVKRLRMLFPFALFTNHDARYFPELRLHAGGAAANPDQYDVLKFDKILCDVVCSGDGTLRKAPHVFKIWSPKEGIHLQKTQIHIALRACHLLRVGGRLVYSTCSLNPIENEAVVAQLIHRTGGAMKLVDGRTMLPQLACSPGMQTWTVTDIRGRVVETPEGNMHEALFPPNTPGGYSSEAVNAVDLSLCMRLFPSHCNGGGFFIAVLDKVTDYSLPPRAMDDDEEGEEASMESGAHQHGSKQKKHQHQHQQPSQANEEDVEEKTRAPESDAAATSTATSSPTEPPAKRSRGDNSGEADGTAAAEDEPATTKKPQVPPQFMSVPEEINTTLRDFYEVPNFPCEYLVLRSAQGSREAKLTTSSQITLVSRTARRVLAEKEDCLTVVSAGLRVLAFESMNQNWRIANEAAPLFAKFLIPSPLAHSRATPSSRVVRVTRPFIEDIIATGGKLKSKTIADIADDALRRQMEEMPLGTIFYCVDGCPDMPDTDGVFFTIGLRARTCVQLQVDHEDIVGMQLRIGLTPHTETDATLAAPVPEE